ncbi:hypothetical protein BXZ70DRAFT_507542 [Cristinia sonorae]|uniref:Uncharacterized protein n=1 Tax=Cristinia sonorae TaxID=1940300 RepID=A0A8K0UUY7_9AGAR|nr:hypothetical protein BXZ70DRAFT_507542 [Cristinia sonorae]
MSILSEFSSTHQQLASLAQSASPLNNDDLVGALTKIRDNTSDSSIAKSEVQSISNALLSIDTTLFRVEQLFGDASSSGSGELSKELRNLLVPWKSIRQRFTNLVWSLRSVAGETEMVVNDFSLSFLNYLLSEDSLSDKTAALEQYGQSLPLDKGTDIVQALLQLQDDLGKTVNDWNAVVSRQNLDVSGVTVVQGSLTTIQSVLATQVELFTKINDLAIKFGLVPKTCTVKGVNVPLSGLAPEFWYSTLLDVLTGSTASALISQAKDEISGLSRKLKEAQSARDTAISELSNVAQLHASILSVQVGLVSITRRVGVIGQVVPAVHADIGEILSLLGLRDQKIINSRISTVNTLYKTTSILLQAYQNAPIVPGQ